MYQLWSQDNFSKGELSPYMYARAQTQQYYDGLKVAQNVIGYPTGAAGKRFGTLFQSILNNITNPNQLYFEVFQYLNICIFQICITPGNIAIYLEGLLVANVSTTLTQTTIASLSTTTLGALFRVCGPGIQPTDLSVALDGGTTVTSLTDNQLTVSLPIFQVGAINPVQFTNSGGSLPIATPSIIAGVTYFVNPTSSTTTYVYKTAYEAKFKLNPIQITNIGTGTTSLFILAIWTFTNTVFKNVPVYDFNGGYDNITFTVSGTTGGQTLTASSPIFNSNFVGGAFIAAGGTARIFAYTSSTVVNINIQDPFNDGLVILGSLALLAEPAWSPTRGWPEVCSSYQNRALFANTQSLPNGFYASVVNNYADFGDLTTDDDDAISWYPTSNNVNVIRFIVPFRSITVHTNSGIYSSPLSAIESITPNTFTLQLQDSTPADVVLPQAIDNQIIVLSGNDAHTMLWDGINNAYTSNIVSIVNEQTIRNPVDESAYADLRRAGSRYVFIVNASGSLAVYQTLLAEQVSGFTPQVMEQSYGSAQFRQVASSVNGRAWFVCERQRAIEQSGITITGFTSSTLTAESSNFNTEIPTAVMFLPGSGLPRSTPQIKTNVYYWVIGIDANTFKVYLDQSDALADEDPIEFSSVGSVAQVVPWLLENIFTLEELTHETYLDCAFYYDGTPESTINTGTLFNAQQVKMVGDGFGYDAIGKNNEVEFDAHGVPTPVSHAYIGFPINTIMQAMPLTPPQGPQTTLTKPKHAKSVRFMFNQTIGGTINGVPIALAPFNKANIGLPPIPMNGFVEQCIMNGWDDFNYPTFTIEHNEPFNIQLIGIFYSEEA